MANYKIGVEFEADGSKAVSAINQVSTAMQNLQNQVGSSSRGTQTQVDSLTSSIRKLSVAFGSYLSASALGGFITDSIKASATLESLKTSFEVFTGSASIATSLMKEFKDQAIKSPMQFQDIVQGGKVLMNYGLTAEQVIPITKMLGDVSGGNADRFQRLSLAFGQVNAMGRLMGQELRQMINAGFNPLQAISEKTGESMDSLTKRMHDGKISVREVAQAFTYATTEGGRFYGNAEKQALTLSGKFNKLGETVFFAMATIGDAIVKRLKLGEIIDVLSEKVDGLAKSFKKANDEAGNQSGWNKLINLLINLGDKGIRNIGETLNTVMGNMNEFLQSIFDITDGVRILTKDFANLVKNVPLLGTIAEKVSNLMGIPKGAEKDSTGYGKYNPSSEREFQKVIDPLKKVQDEYKKLWDTFKSGATGSGDSLTKAERERYKELLSLSRIGISEVEGIQKQGLDKRLSDLQNAFNEELDKYRKFGLDVSKIVVSQSNVLTEVLLDAENQRQAKLISEHFEMWQGLNSEYQRQEDSFYEKRKKAIQDLADETKGIAGEIPKSFADFVSEFVKEDGLNRISDFAQATYSAFKDFSVNITSGVVEAMSASIMAGESMADAIRTFGSTILSAFGDMLIKVGTSAVIAGTVGKILKSFTTGGLLSVPDLGIAGGIMAITTGTALKAMANSMKSAKSAMGSSASTALSSSRSNLASGMATGSSYQYGGASYATQTVRLLIDLTGAITASPTGYNINKSLETNLRITGR